MIDKAQTVVWCFDVVSFSDMKIEDLPDIKPSANPLQPIAMPDMPVLRVLSRKVTFTS
jgi:hypothetical protein